MDKLEKRSLQKHKKQLRRDARKKMLNASGGAWKINGRSPNDPLLTTEQREASRIGHLRPKKSRAKLAAEERREASA